MGKHVFEKTLFYENLPGTLKKLKSLICIHLNIDKFDIEGYEISHVTNNGELCSLLDEDQLEDYFKEKGLQKYIEIVVTQRNLSFMISSPGHSKEDMQKYICDFDTLKTKYSNLEIELESVIKENEN